VTEKSLLLELGVPFRRGAGGLLVEAQALNGLRLWSQHFDRVTVCAAEMPADMPDGSTTVWADPAELLAQGRVILEALPWGYRPADHFRFRDEVKRRFAALVPAHRYLCFSNLGAFGAWGNLAAAEARRRAQPYSLWFDWVLHEMPAASGRGVMQAVKGRVLSAITKHETYKAVRACSLGLFHGQTVYDAYSPLCKQPALVHDIHVHPEDAIGDAALAAKVEATLSEATLRVGYVGRVHPMKAPFQWIDAVAQAVGAVGPGRIAATWLGDGPLLDEARERVRGLGLESSIRFAGFVSDRAVLLSFLREQNVLAFCHITPESPRCLIEALISGTPLVGYESAYARELVADRGGAALSPVGDAQALARSLIALATDRQALRQLTVQAATARSIYNDEAVFEHRSELIKRFL
jgi:glycosyltransferase involved in cell wall biosynthesis